MPISILNKMQLVINKVILQKNAKKKTWSLGNNLGLIPVKCQVECVLTSLYFILIQCSLKSAISSKTEVKDE